MIRFKHLSTIQFAFVLGLAAFGDSFSQDRPNILWLTIEDMSPHLGSYGYSDSKTPVLDGLAAKGVLYKNAFVTAPVCAVARSAILTGTMSSTQGTHHMRNEASLGATVKTYPELMRTAGYYTTNPGKKGDYQGLAAGPEIWNKFYPATDDYTNRPDKSKPFMHVDNEGMGCMHESCNSDKNQTVYPDPGKLTSFPPYYPDTPKARKIWAQYYANVNGVDGSVSKKLQQLNASGEADNTIIFVYSDHGAGLPRAKRWVYESGLQIALIVYVPPKWQHLMPHAPGTKTNELVNALDITATALHLAGVTLPEYVQGRPFMGKNLTPQRKYIHGHRDRMDERYELIRTVRDSRYKYIRNYEYWKERLQFNHYAELNTWSGIFEEIRRVYSEPNPPSQVKWYFQNKTVEELYDLETDPHEMKDLARNPEHRAKLAELRNEHLRWRRESRDLGSIPEGIILDRKAKGAYKGEYDYGKDKAAEIEKTWNVVDSLHLYSADELIALASNSDMAIRYWAVMGLGNLRDNSKKGSDALKGALADPGIWVSVAAARGLLLLGDSPEALVAIKKGLAHTEGNVRLLTVNFADDLGNRVASIQPEIKATKEWRDAAAAATRTIATLNDPAFAFINPVIGCPDPGFKEFNEVRTADDQRLCKTPGPLSITKILGNQFTTTVLSENLHITLPQVSDYQVQIQTLKGEVLGVHEIKQKNNITIQTAPNQGWVILEITGKGFKSSQKILLK